MLRDRLPLPGSGGDRVTIVYTAGLGGRLSALDGPGHNLSDVARHLDALRRNATDKGESVILVDLGGSLHGVGVFNASHGGTPMAGAMKLARYDAVLPDLADIWRGPDEMKRLAGAGGFAFVLANAETPSFEPVVRRAGRLRIAIHGIYAPPHPWAVDEDGPPPRLVLARNVDGLRAEIARTPADLHVVLANVRDPGALLGSLPANVVVIPGPDAASPGPGDTRLAPTLEGPADIGRVVITCGDEIPRVACSREATSVGATEPQIEAAVRGERAEFEKGLGNHWRSVAEKVTGWAEPQQALDEPGSAIADLVADTLSVDVAVLAPGEAGAVEGGVLSEVGLARIVDPRARVRIVWASGAEVQAWLEKDVTEELSVSGLAIWRKEGGGLVLAVHQGRPLCDCKRLRVAVSTRLSEIGDRGRSLLEVVRTGLHQRPYLAAAPARWFVAGDGALDSAALLGRGGEAAGSDPQAAARLWVEALARTPLPSTATALLKTMATTRPDRFPSYLEVARLANRAGSWQLAWEALDMGRTAYPDAWSYPLAQARLLVVHGLPLEAVPLLHSAARLGAPPDQIALLRGIEALMVGDPHTADQVFSRALSQANPTERTRFRALTALARIRRGDGQGALSVWGTSRSAAAPARSATASRQAAAPSLQADSNAAPPLRPGP
jgi:hypothetical protein